MMECKEEIENLNIFELLMESKDFNNRTLKIQVVTVDDDYENNFSSLQEKIKVDNPLISE